MGPFANREEHEVEPTPKMTLAERMGYGVKGKQIVAASVQGATGNREGHGTP